MPSRPIVISPDLAYSIGLNEAIVLQQVHYWLKETTSGMEHDGARWIYNTSEQWLEQFPFWSESTLKRTFTNLKKLGLLRIEQLNQSQRDMTNFYTINYESDLLDEVKVASSMKSKRANPSVQNDQMEQVKKKRSISSDRPDVIRSNWHDDPTEITTESTTEITGKPSCPVAGQPDEPELSPLEKFLDSHPDAYTWNLSKRQWGTEADLVCAQWIWKLIRKMYQDAAEQDPSVSIPADPDWHLWANDVRLMRTLDGRTHKQICELYKRVNQDAFWKKNIKSPSKLREQWDEVTLKLSPAVNRPVTREDQAFKATHGQVDYSLPDNAGFRT